MHIIDVTYWTDSTQSVSVFTLTYCAKNVWTECDAPWKDDLSRPKNTCIRCWSKLDKSIRSCEGWQVSDGAFCQITLDAIYYHDTVRYPVHLMNAVTDHQATRALIPLAGCYCPHSSSPFSISQPADNPFTMQRRVEELSWPRHCDTILWLQTVH